MSKKAVVLGVFFATGLVSCLVYQQKDDPVTSAADLDSRMAVWGPNGPTCHPDNRYEMVGKTRFSFGAWTGCPLDPISDWTIGFYTGFFPSSAATYQRGRLKTLGPPAVVQAEGDVFGFLLNPLGEQHFQASSGQLVFTHNLNAGFSFAPNGGPPLARRTNKLRLSGNVEIRTAQNIDGAISYFTAGIVLRNPRNAHLFTWDAWIFRYPDGASLVEGFAPDSVVPQPIVSTVLGPGSSGIYGTPCPGSMPTAHLPFTGELPFCVEFSGAQLVDIVDRMRATPGFIEAVGHVGRNRAEYFLRDVYANAEMYAPNNSRAPLLGGHVRNLRLDTIEGPSAVLGWVDGISYGSTSPELGGGSAMMG